MVHGQGMTFERQAFAALVAGAVARDGFSYAYERSPYYVMNTARRGAEVVQSGDGILVLASHLDQRDAASLVFFSHGRLLQPERLARAAHERLGERGLFIHHLLPHTRDQILGSFPAARLVDRDLSAALGACVDEDTYPQVILLPKQLPRAGGSVVEKRRALDNLVRGNRHLSRELAAYYNHVEREASGQLCWAGELPAPAPVAALVQHVIAAATASWIAGFGAADEHACRCHISALQNMTALLTREPPPPGERRIIARIAFDWKANHGGFWLAEHDVRRSTLIPHVILSDLHYKNEYTFLLYDILRWAYIHGVDAVNLGGAETEALFSLKSQLFHILPEPARKLRKLDTVYVPPGGLMHRGG